MKYLQGKFIFGFLTVYVRGERPELFFKELANSGIYTWQVIMQNEHLCQGNIRSFDINFVQKIAQDHGYEITLGNKRGLPYLFNRLWRRKELIVASLLSFIFLVGLSQVIWTIDISGVSKEVEVKINDTLKKQGVKLGSFKFLLDQTSHIQQNILQEVPELLWIGVEQKGTRLTFTGIEKITQDNIDGKESPQHLVAGKNGIVHEMRITKGVPLVSINDFVKTGDKLVSGNLFDALPEERIDEDETIKDQQLVTAKGEVIAKTWYEVQVSIPLEVNYDTITSNHLNKYYLSVGDKRLLVWGFKQPKFKFVHIESDERSIINFKQGWPIIWVKDTLHEKREYTYKRTEKEAKAMGMAQAKVSLKRQLGKNANILSQKVLHEATESGKVKLNLLITVKENIAKEIPITQGD